MTEEYGHISDAFDNLPEEELLMTETDISKVLIEGEYATIMGVKYKRVEESKPRMEYQQSGTVDKV
jgi:hypothetical protein